MSANLTAQRTAFGRRIFGNRLYVGFLAIGLAACVVHPRAIFGAHQVVGTWASVGLVLLGLAGRVWAGGTAGRHTRRAVIEAPGLVTGGPFAHVRNPIYLASIVLGLGMVLLVGDPWLFAIYVGVFVLLYSSIVPAEEQFLRGQFGEDYLRYCANVPRFLPQLRPWREAKAARFDWSTLQHELKLGLMLVAIYYGLHWIAQWRMTTF